MYTQNSNILKNGYQMEYFDGWLISAERWALVTIFSCLIFVKGIHPVNLKNYFPSPLNFVRRWGEILNWDAMALGLSYYTKLSRNLLHLQIREFLSCYFDHRVCSSSQHFAFRGKHKFLLCEIVCSDNLFKQFI